MLSTLYPSAAVDFHSISAANAAWWYVPKGVTTVNRFSYSFENFFHPYVGQLLETLNRDGLKGVLAPATQGLRAPFFPTFYTALTSTTVGVSYTDKLIDQEFGGAYANYNWELFFHLPLTVAVHLSKNQRFAEAERWFHLIFDPRGKDVSVPTPARFWNFLRFRKQEDLKQIDDMLRLLSTAEADLSAADKGVRQKLIAGYRKILAHPFQPHAVARTRVLAYKYNVIMKYLDNLIAWGDSLFLQDTVESINEATQHYVSAANLLGDRPQEMPRPGLVRPKNFADLRGKLDAMANAMVAIEGEFPLNMNPAPGAANPQGAPLFGVGNTLYFSIPRNTKLLGYWDIVADRLFKIRNSLNIQGVFRQLPLFDPPIDPGMLVKAAAAGLDIGSIVNGLNQPLGPVRSQVLIQKALELAAEVKGLGGSLLAAIEKGDGERLAQLRQTHELALQRRSRDVRFLQWKQAQESTESLLRSRATALERYRYYQRMLGAPPEPNAAADTVALDRRELTEENFDDAYAALVGAYELSFARQPLPALRLAGASSPTGQAGASGSGRLYLSSNENADLNVHRPMANDLMNSASGVRQAAPILGLIPQFPIHIQFWGLGGEIQFGGEQLSKMALFAADLLNMASTIEGQQADNASKTAGFERRADDWILQGNLAARELVQNGRQIIGSLIAEQIARHEYDSICSQIEETEEIDRFLKEKFSNEELYAWMQGEISRLYYEYYRLAFDTARKAERTMKQELMRPELDQTDFIQFNYWDGGRKGLLSGETLHLDLKRMELAYLDNNKREIELTRHVSLRQLDPLALLNLRVNGNCDVSIPEWLYDRDCPGHYLRRIKSVAVSIPSVVGPYTGVNCKLSLLRSTVRRSPLLKDQEYVRDEDGDDRFIDYFGAVQSVVTSSGTNDAGLFEPNLREERFLPFEGAGAESTWRLELPGKLRSFDYRTIADVVLHVRYTARDGGAGLAGKAAARLEEILKSQDLSRLTQLFSLPFDFPTEWAAFTGSTANLTLRIRKDFFPYLVQEPALKIAGLDLYGVKNKKLVRANAAVLAAFETELNGPNKAATLTLAPDADVLTRTAEQVFLCLRYSL